MVSDITTFKPNIPFDVWHDRAAFHFLTEAEDISRYASIASSFVKGYLSVGTFSKQGPFKCSGLNISQYSEEELISVFSSGFYLIDSKIEDHKTPFDTLQNFLFCSFKKK